MLNESATSITHIEDLPLRDFIRTVESLKDKVIDPKIDGANLDCGFDENGFFTSRELKSPRRARFYSVDDYPKTANDNAFRAAHLALEKEQETIKKYLKEGDLVEMEILLGKQPNTVIYGGDGKNYIVFIRGVNGTPNERVANLANALNKKRVTVNSVMIDSPDGDKLNEKEEKTTWQFMKINPIDTSKINTKEALKILEKMKEYIAQRNDALDMTNQEVAELNLNHVDRSKRNVAKTARDTVNKKIMKDFKEPIKQVLLNNIVRKHKPYLQDDKVSKTASDIGAEGVVIRDPVTGSQTKIVDKDVFTAINTFNSAVRSNISGLTKTTAADAPIEQKGGVFGEARIKIAHLLGAEELALSSSTRNFITQYKSTDPESTAREVAAHLDIKSLPGVRTKISTILNLALKKINSILGDFKKESGGFKLELKNGKKIGITPEVMKRTLTAFAETKKEISELDEKVLKSRTAGELIMALYGKIISSIFDEKEQEVKESLMQSINNMPAAGDLPGADKVLKGGRLVTKRVRRFVRPKKFPVPKSVEQNVTDGADPAGIDEEAGAGTTSAGGIGNFQQPMFMSRANAKEGPISRIPIQPKKKKKPYALLNSILNGTKVMKEDWAHLKDMKFATNVDTNPNGRNDVEFDKLRNTAIPGDNPTPMDVNRYLNKAHDINDEVDTVTYGMETDTGAVAKVYVNASQADEFEKALAYLLGKESDLEEVVNLLANKFDIVDVEWPPEMVQTQNVDSEVPAGPAPELPPSEVQDGDSINYELEPEGVVDGASDDDTPQEGDEDGNDESDEGTSDDEEDDGQERDDFGQVISKDSSPEDTSDEAEETESGDSDGAQVPDVNPDEPDGAEHKDDEESESEDESDEDTSSDDEEEKPKKKKRKKKEESDEDSTNESLSLLKSIVLKEAGTNPSFANISLQAISDMLIALGFDPNVNQSFVYQAKQLVAKNTPGLLAAKQTSVAQKITTARDALSQALQVAAGSAPPAAQQAATSPITSSYKLLGSIINEFEK